MSNCYKFEWCSFSFEHGFLQPEHFEDLCFLSFLPEIWMFLLTLVTSFWFPVHVMGVNVFCVKWRKMKVAVTTTFFLLFFFSNINKYFVSGQCGLTIVWNDTIVNTCVSMFCMCTMYMRLLLYPSETISTYQFMIRCIEYPTLSIVREIIHHFLYFCTHAQQHQFLNTQNILCSHFHRETMWKKSP